MSFPPNCSLEKPSSGQAPNPAVIFHAEDWGVIPFSLLWDGFAIFWFLGASGLGDFSTHRPDKTFQWFGVIWGTPFVLAGQYLIWGRFIYNRWRKQRTYYALTNRRALIVEHGFSGRKGSSSYFENMTMVDKWVRRDALVASASAALCKTSGGGVEVTRRVGQLLLTWTMLMPYIRLLID
jgi:hypothetical protein